MENSSTQRSQLFDQLISSLREFIVVLTDPGGQFTTWHPGVEHVFGYSQEEFIGQNSEILLPPAERLRGSNKWELQQAEQQGRASGTRALVSKAGREIMVDSLTVPLRSASGGLLGFGKVLRVFNPQPEHVALQRELDKANLKLQALALELERSNEELEEFARIASHDLSAPITSTRWVVELLSSRHSAGLDEAGRGCVKQISQGLDRMSELVAGVVAHARVGTTAIASQRCTHCEDALGAAIDKLRGHIDTSGAQIQYGSLPAVEVKPEALYHLFQNLLSNALKYRKPDVPPRIVIAAEWKESLWTISVSDNGIGIEPEWLERIFQPMQRRHGLEVDGSGIGLATCRKIVSRVGGVIWVESQFGAGATFYCTLPGPAPSLGPDGETPAAADRDRLETAP